ncbi:MAG TPA: hypothetical protein VJP85_10705 [Candidatus Baltobacteraceae bacterium]|nr:hypothetical protein [Candidatus Baltobacteraceae bacterium]
MKANIRAFRACGPVLIAALLAACSTNGGAQLPSVSQAPLQSNTLQLAVGTANIGQDGTVGLNVVATLRQPSGASAVLANQPTLTLPAGMLVPAGAPGAYGGIVAGIGANVDAGTNHISASPQVPLNNAGLINSTFGTFTGVFSYGFGPFNSDQNTASVGAYYIGVPNASGGNGFESSTYANSNSLVVAQKRGDPTQPLPFFSSDPMDYVVGPPAVPFFNNGQFPVGFAGYSPGFTVFEMPPVAGKYTLSVNVPATNTSPVTYSKDAMLASTAALGPITVTFTPNASADGGATGTVNVPAGVTETEVFIVDVTSNLYFTVGPLTGTGVVNYTFPNNLGACTTNCPQPSMAAGDSVLVAAVGYDYPAFEAGPPANKSASPAITNSTNGQADITMSPVSAPITY